MKRHLLIANTFEISCLTFKDTNIIQLIPELLSLFEKKGKRMLNYTFSAFHSKKQLTFALRKKNRSQKFFYRQYFSFKNIAHLFKLLTPERLINQHFSLKIVKFICKLYNICKSTLIHQHADLSPVVFWFQHKLHSWMLT